MLNEGKHSFRQNCNDGQTISKKRLKTNFSKIETLFNISNTTIWDIENNTCNLESLWPSTGKKNLKVEINVKLKSF